MGITLMSEAFEDGGEIPPKYTADSDNVSPPLAWTGVPAEAKSLVLIMDDPDAPDPAAPQRIWTHWVLYNIPPDNAWLKEGIESAKLPGDAREGLNDWKEPGYGGPKPPIGTHRYFHKLFALDVTLPDLGQPSRSELEQAMQGHVIEQGHLVGLYGHKPISP
jgi:Raf kinase inhibitor-like YbhB/YbcL family protein